MQALFGGMGNPEASTPVGQVSHCQSVTVPLGETIPGRWRTQVLTVSMMLNHDNDDLMPPLPIRLLRRRQMII